MMWTGWIEGAETDADHLKSLGVQLGRREGNQWVDCMVSDDALDALDEWWESRYIWGLDPVEEADGSSAS